MSNSWIEELTNPMIKRLFFIAEDGNFCDFGLSIRPVDLENSLR
jgi:hypothetical protein